MGWSVDGLMKANEVSTSASFDNRTSVRGGTRTAQVNSYVQDFKGIGELGTYSVVGIRGDGARLAADNIVAKCDEVMKEIDGIEIDQSVLDSAFKGEDLQAAFRNYVNSVKLYCEAAVSDIKAFADKIYEVAEQWKASQATYATNVVGESATSSFADGTTDFYKTTKASAASAGPTVPGEAS